MSDESASKSDWAIVLTGRLCLMGWVCAILYECFDFFRPVRQLFFTVGPWICLIALLHAIVFLLVRRQGIFLVFVLIAVPPTIHFGIVLRNIAIENKLIDPAKPIDTASPSS